MTYFFDVVLPTTLYGIPYPLYEPKSGWSPWPSPIEAMRTSESARTGRPSTRRFQMFVLGNIGQPEAPGSDLAAAPSTEPARRAMTARRRAILRRMGRRPAGPGRTIIVRS